MLDYVSTRGKAPRLNFGEVTQAGLATDGGLYVPDGSPVLAGEEFTNMAAQNYLEIAWRVILPFVEGSIKSSDLINILRASYKDFAHKEIAPLRRFDDNFYIQELFHGPTLAFKDVALQFLGHVFDYLLAKNGSRVTIVGATSGDTGSAAIEAFKGKQNADIFILHPKGRVSDVQRRQMTTVAAPNVHNIAIEGSFDDCQDIVKALFNDQPFRDEMHLSAVNSINWARILAQIVYYVYAGSRVGKPVTFCVPTGNFGNVYAGYAARIMGLPIDRLVVATNKNDILFRFLATGRMKAEGVAPSLSPSMDIQVSSNFERILFDIFGRKGDAVDQTMRHFRETGPFQLDDLVMHQLRKTFAAGRQDDAETLAVMKRFYQRHNYVLDPHTAVGVGVAEQYREKYKDSAIVCLATAHPAKFPAAVKEAIGIEPALPEHLADLHTRPEKYQIMQNDVAKVKDFVKANATRA